MTAPSTSPTTSIEHRINRLAEKAASARHVHSLVLGVRTDDGQIDVRAAAAAVSQIIRFHASTEAVPA